MSKVKIIKSIRKKLFPLETKPGPGAKDKFKKLDPKSPYYNVDELGSPPLHRGGGASGVQKKKQKMVGPKIHEGFEKKDKAKKIRDLRRLLIIFTFAIMLLGNKF